MKNLGGAKAQVLDTLPLFDKNRHVAKIILCKDTNYVYIGGINCWINLGLSDGSIFANHLNLGYDIYSKNKINAEYIPIKINDNISNIQTVFEQIHQQLIETQNGKNFKKRCLGNNHIDGKSSSGFTADDMFLRNGYGGFDNAQAYTVSVEKAIELIQIRLNKIESILGGLNK